MGPPEAGQLCQLGNNFGRIVKVWPEGFMVQWIKPTTQRGSYPLSDWGRCTFPWDGHKRCCHCNSDLGVDVEQQ